ncbi:MAG: hypothetical protein J6B62_01460 [Bacteroidales bacterium]|nr:hypothetical protein [Bacteroidales bacterium]
MRKIFVLLAGMVLFLASSLTFIYVKGENDSVNDLLSANVDALADEESGGKLDTSYKNIPSNCVIKVGAKAKVEIFGIGILEADGEGNISFAGRVVCESNGHQTCSPVECVDLYRVIFRPSEQ